MASIYTKCCKMKDKTMNESTKQATIRPIVIFIPVIRSNMRYDELLKNKRKNKRDSK